MAEKEYIEREALLGIFDAAISHLRDRAGGDGILLASIGLVQKSRDLVAEFPTADVAEVVRCRYCEYREKDDVGRYFCGLGDFYIGDTDYCSRGRHGAKMDGKGEG